MSIRDLPPDFNNERSEINKAQTVCSIISPTSTPRVYACHIPCNTPCNHLVREMSSQLL